MDSKKKNILIVGNGSGGHFYPSFVVANELRKNGFNVYYVVAKNRLDHKIIAKSTFFYLALEYVGLNKNYLTFIKTQILNIEKIKKYIVDNKIQMVIGFGGGLSFSAIVSGKIKKVKCLIHEQNIILGRANKLLAKNTTLLTSYKSTSNSKNTVFVGNPVVSKIYNQTNKYFDIIIVFGSQGSKTLNKIFDSFLKSYNGKYRILFISGEKDFDYQNKNIKCVSKVDSLKPYFANAKFVFTRGGATTLAELSMFNTKVCVIPSPYVINDHQTKNAIQFKNEYGCLIVKEKELNEKIINKILKDSLNEFLNYNNRIKIEKTDYLEIFIKEIKNAL